MAYILIMVIYGPYLDYRVMCLVRRGIDKNVSQAQGYKMSSCSSQVSIKLILLINVKIARVNRIFMLTM